MNFFNLSLLALTISTFCDNLTAVPIYASQWKRGDQTVTMYGDFHANNHPFDQAQADTFIAHLVDTNKKTLVLIEESNALRLFKACGLKKSNETFSDQFLSMISLKLLQAQNLGTMPHIFIKNIDDRRQCDFETLFMHTFRITPEKKHYWDKLNNYVSINSLSKLIEWPIERIDQLIETSYDPIIKDFFGDMIQIFRSKQLLFFEYLQYLNMTNNLEDFSVDAVLAMNPEQRNLFNAYLIKNYYKIFDIPLVTYEAELLDAVALWNIAGNKIVHNNIIVCAGFFHINNIERFLKQLGYNQQKLWAISESIKEYVAPYLNHCLYKNSSEYESLCTIPDRYFGKCKNYAIDMDFFLNYPSLLEKPLPKITPVNPHVFSWISDTDTSSDVQRVKRAREEV